MTRLASVLIVRFLLDLQEANQQELALSSDDSLDTSATPDGSLKFARVMGSIASTREFGAGVSEHSEDE